MQSVDICTYLLLLLFSYMKTHRQVYDGSNGRKKFPQCAVCLMDRDGLDERLKEIHCPVLIIHGTSDNVYSVPLAKKMQQDFSNADLEII
jgi:pimeloyl-ACP methyl ester carboxylesterase